MNATYLQDARTKLEEAKQLLASIKTRRGDTMVLANDLAIALDSLMATASLYQSVHPDLAMREAAEQIEQETSKFATELSLDKGFYEAVSAMNEASLDAEGKRWREHTLRDFRRSGVDKDDAARAEIQRLNDALVQVSQDFARNIREDTRTLTLASKDDLRGLPEDYVKAHENTLTVTTDSPDYVPFMTYADNGGLREQMYKIYRQRAHPKNVEVLQTLLEHRHALAQLLGYANYADYVTETRMIRSGKAAENFVERIATLAEKQMQKDYGMLLERKRQDDPKASVVNEWERGYLEEKVKREKYGFSAQTVRPYFSYARVKQGVLGTTATLFGVQFKPVSEPAWHTSVETFDVLRGGAVIGRFMLDMHPRKDKYKHAAQFTLQSGVKDRQIPIGALVCNFPDPKEGPALMEHKDVVTFFHEFGHLMHHIFGGAQRFVRFSGVATEWDFVEAPSQMLEEWAWDYEVLSKFALHHETGAVIPRELVAKMRAADEFSKGIQTRVQMFYAALSLAYYSQDPKGLNTTQTLAELQKRYSPFAYVPDTYFHLGFGHLDGYSAGYYTYMWSLVIAKDLLSAFQDKGLMHPETAARYRDEVLAKGGSADAHALIEAFLGRPYSFEAYESWLSRAPA